MMLAAVLVVTSSRPSMLKLPRWPPSIVVACSSKRRLFAAVTVAPPAVPSTWIRPPAGHSRSACRSAAAGLVPTVTSSLPSLVKVPAPKFSMMLASRDRLYLTVIDVVTLLLISIVCKFNN